DAAGNTGVASAGLTVTIDTTAPSNISLNANTFMDLSTGISTALATLSSSDVHQVRYALVAGNGTNDSGNGGFVISGNSLQSARDLSAGTYNVRVSATDAAGNVSYQDLRIIVTPHPAVNRPDVAVSSPVRTVQPSVMEDTTMPVIPVNIVSVPAPSAYLVQSSERVASIEVPAMGRTVNGFSVPVLNRESASSPEVMVLRGMSDQSAVRVGSQLVVNFEVPASTFAHTDPSAVVTLTAVMADGKPLPAWLKFNPLTGEFRGIAPANYSGLLELSMVATDNQGSKAVTRFKIDLTAKPAKTSDLGKPRLQAELRGQSSFVWKAERDAWIRHAREVGKTGRAVTSA
ncbi:MAG: putative Ig domain-containing protein, partial [Limnohabitans sp.]